MQEIEERLRASAGNPPLQTTYSYEREIPKTKTDDHPKPEVM